MTEINPIIKNFIMQHCDLDGNGKILGEKEVSIFNAMCKSFNINPENFDENDENIAGLLNLEIHHTPKVEQKPDKNQTIVVNKEVLGKKISFSYNQALIEDYIINNAKDAHGRLITRFKLIPEIRAKDKSLRSKKEQDLLDEFDNMMKYAIEAGTEYGIDPNLILSIIQREVCFNGLSENVVGVNGKGYMQLTSSPIRDMLGAYTKNDVLVYGKSKIEKYGQEIVDLFSSRGFNINCSEKNKPALLKRIMDYLKENKDPEFNIRLGTLLLRRIYIKNNGNIYATAKAYNGHPDNMEKYGRAIANDIYPAIKKHVA